MRWPIPFDEAAALAPSNLSAAIVCSGPHQIQTRSDRYGTHAIVSALLSVSKMTSKVRARNTQHKKFKLHLAGSIGVNNLAKVAGVTSGSCAMHGRRSNVGSCRAAIRAVAWLLPLA
jgi:hypothetical protein